MHKEEMKELENMIANGFMPTKENYIRFNYLWALRLELEFEEVL